MNKISISQLKAHPAKAIIQSIDYPVVVESRNQVKAYLLGKNLYENIVTYIENFIDKKTVQETDFSKGKDFEKIAKQLGI